NWIHREQDMLYFYFDGTTILDGGVNDIRAVGTVVLLTLMVLAIVGMDWVTRVQMGMFVLLVCSQLDVIIGSFIGPLDDESMARGFVGWNGEVFSENTFKDYRYYDGVDQNFISVFAVFFTSVTGIVAGANLSGDLKDPSSAIPKGTLLAIGITFCFYLLYPFLLSANVVRDASGDVEAFREFYYNDTDFLSGRKSILDAPVFTECSTTGHPIVTADNITIPVCEFGLENSSQVMELVAAWGPLIYLGCFAATLSSAIASLVGAPRVLQALAKDRLYPGIFMFSKGYGANNDPVRGYCLVFVLSFLCIMIGNLNAVSTVLSNFFLASYSLINFSCFHASLVKSPGWR
ncbi:Amino acid permease/ SLC12A domain, partial [Trinorchestia longiramus]